MKLIRLKDLPETGASDNPEVIKKVILSKGLMPGLMMFSRCFFKSGQETFKHKHPTMFETYYVLEGEGIVNINGKDYTMKPDDCIVIEPGEEHFVKNPGPGPLSYLYFGIATD